MKIGYSYWGFLADVKMNEQGERISTPDGNAFYSWSIIQAFQKENDTVVSIMPDRDRFAAKFIGLTKMFSAWATAKRAYAYERMQKINYEKSFKTMTKDELFEIWNANKVNELDFILHEWRMLIEGRNDEASRSFDNWQPDFWIQECLIEYCKNNNIKLIIFDLDYKLSEDKFEEICDFAKVIELGNKWLKSKFADKARKVYIPFDFDSISEFQPKINPENNLVYVGNRYERDWCIDKYIPENLEKCVVYGNWKESGRDSESRWPCIEFGKRLQTEEMHDVYSNSKLTILLAKKEYCDYSFMTARLIEAVFYGTVPLFIEEYGAETIQEYAGAYASSLTVKSKEEVISVAEAFEGDELLALRIDIINYLRNRLSKMDAKNIVQILKDML